MKLQIHCDQRARMATVVMDGELNFQSVTSAFDQMLEHPSFRSGMNALWDFRLTEINMVAGDASKLVEHVRSRRGRRGFEYRLAIVARTPEQWSLARLVDLLSTPLAFEVRLFGDHAVALQWLERDISKALEHIPFFGSGSALADLTPSPQSA